MRSYRLALVLALAGAGMLTSAAVISRHKSASASAASGRGGAVWGARYFPNVELTTHDGRRVRFFDDLIKDKVVVINFIYTSCPDSCPLETARLLDVQRVLGDRLGKDVFFYSITIDPERDTQPVLKAFAENWGIPAEGWEFLTGDEDDIVLLRQKLGVSIEDVRTAELKDHDLNLVMGNQATGRWMKRSPFENPYVLANQLGSWLHNWKTASAVERDYADAPELRQITTGEDLFRTRCAACHTIGDGDIVEVAERRIGPDLYDVTRQREREWLERWLAEPDKMLEEKDPLATSLLAKYKNIPMPNLQLKQSDVVQLLGYMDQESRRIGALRARTAAKPGGADDSHHDHAAAHGEHTGHSGQH